MTSPLARLQALAEKATARHTNFRAERLASEDNSWTVLADGTDQAGNSMTICFGDYLTEVAAKYIAAMLTDGAAILADYVRMRKALDEVDGLIADYGIDTVGTGHAPPREEQLRVDRIVEAVLDRREALAASRLNNTGGEG